jgi:type II secretory ATPase GspE/PulE/Tfp pilus assembly ATPase PilB-like protein
MLPEPEPQALQCVPARLAVHYAVLPLRLEEGALVVAIEDPSEVDLIDELELGLGRPVTAVAASRTAILEAIRECYGIGADTLEQLSSLQADDAVGHTPEDVSVEDASADASIMKFVNELLVDGFKSRATDIHLEPFEDRLRVRYRIDGVLFDARIPESVRHFREAIATRIKVMARMDIAERRLPQDGRIRVRIGSKDLDLRVSVIPIVHGESVNLRLLQSSSVLMGFERIGFEESAIHTLQELMSRPNGIVLLTGPTGSGKTTTLYACLAALNETDRKIITIEDPVEYQVAGICQMQVRTPVGFTFATGLRSMLRHDPDVMMVGEIRDFETAELAVRCALTGHLVFSTLHTNDAAGSMPRLIDMGVEPYLLASSVEAVIAQRLVRQVCAHCREQYTPDSQTLAAIGLHQNDGAFLRGRGCDMCRHSGYAGRTVIYEILLLDEDIGEAILKRCAASEIKRLALDKGMLSLRKHGIARAKAGATTVEEVLRVTQTDERGAGTARG